MTYYPQDTFGRITSVVQYFTYIYRYTHTHVIISRKFRLKETWRLMKAIAEMKLDTDQTVKLKQLHKVGSEWKLNSWPDNLVG